MTVPRPAIPLRFIGALFVMLAVLLAWSGALAGGHAGFKDEVLPIFQKYCVECHQPGKEGFKKSGLDMTSYNGVMKGTTFGPVVVPGDPFLSNLIVLIEGRADPRIKMPHNRREMSKWERHMIRAWFNRGARNN